MIIMISIGLIKRFKAIFNILILYMVVSKRGKPMRRRYRVKKAPKSLKNQIIKIVDKHEQSKVETNQLSQTIYDSIATGINFNSSISAPLGIAELYNVIPDISRANNAASYQREGDKITPLFCNIKWNLSIGSGQPIHAYLFVLRDKIQQDGNGRGSAAVNFLNLNGGNTNFDGSWVNSCLPVDTEQFQVIKRKKISLTYDAQPGGSPTAPTESGKMFKEYTLKLNMQKYIKQLDYYGYPSTANQPKNFNIFWCIGYLNADGTTDSTGRLRVTCLSTIYFKDA